MPRQLLLDGDDVDALMERVRTEMGPDAVVVKAERVRSGGVAGFFAKQRFELTVEVPDPEPAALPSVATVQGPRGIAALLDAADAADVGSGHVVALPTQAAAPAEAADGPARATSAAPDGDTAAPDGDTAEGARFAALLAAFGVDREDVPALAAWADGQPDVPRQHPAARFAAPGTPVTAATFAPLPVEQGDDASPAAAPIAAAPPLAAPVAAAPPASAPQPAPVPVAPTAPVPAALPPSTGGATRRGLGELGIPESLLGVGPLDEPLPLSHLLAGMPRPPAPLRTPGAVVAVVGEGTEALAAAAQLAHRLRVDPQDVVRAGTLRPAVSPDPRPGAPAADAGVARVRIVAIGVGPDEEDWPAAADLVAQVAPDQCWAVVDARLKAADLRAWMRGVGRVRPFDVVAATRVQDTREPGTVLTLDAPVGWLEGLPATPVVWAAVLSERLGVDARWD